MVGVYVVDYVLSANPTQWSNTVKQFVGNGIRHFLDPINLFSGGYTLAPNRWFLRVLALRKETKGAGVKIRLTFHYLDKVRKNFFFIVCSSCQNYELYATTKNIPFWLLHCVFFLDLIMEALIEIVRFAKSILKFVYVDIKVFSPLAVMSFSMTGMTWIKMKILMTIGLQYRSVIYSPWWTLTIIFRKLRVYLCV